MSAVCIGTRAPEFTLPASNGTTISLMDYRGEKFVVLYFYPKDMTPGCTQEAIAFRDLQSEFQMAGAVILGVSTDDLESHKAFASKYGLTFPLLSDVEGAIAEKYGVLKPPATADAPPKVQRMTFVIDKDGRVVRIYNQIKLHCHADEVLAFLHGQQEAPLESSEPAPTEVTTS